MGERTTVQTEKSKKRVIITFGPNKGWTLSFFEDINDIPAWVRAMEKKYGKIETKKVTDCLLYIKDDN